MEKLMREFKKSVEIMDKLRSRRGCPWDKEQTVDTLKKYIVEEAYEVIEALEEKHPARIAEELGDLFFQILFQARIAKENKQFGLCEVLKGLNEKMVRRHPHVFGRLRGKIKDSKTVLINWSALKKTEGKESALDGTPVAMPTLLRAYRMTEKASAVGFDWREVGEIVEKLEEEIKEFKKEVCGKGKNANERIKDEIGDMIFTVVNVSRFLEIDPDAALRKSVEKFKKRFHYIEASIKKRKKDIRKVSLKEMEDLWIEAKSRRI